MSRMARKQSEADVYHVMVRGEGRRLLFEDDEDRECFLRFATAAAERYDARVYAWCLMANHVHLLVKVPFQLLPRFMQSLTSGYAVYFNQRHDAVGHAFAGRFRSEPVDTDEYLLTVVRYIHMNPVKGGLAPTCDYRWSSYREYLGQDGLADTEFVLGVIGGVEPFRALHAVDTCSDGALAPEIGLLRSRWTDEDALALMKDLLGEGWVNEIPQLGKARRDEGIALLRRMGVTVKQVERLTGIGRGIVSRVKWRE